MTTSTTAPATTVPKPEGLKDAATHLIAAKLLVDGYTHAVLAQPAFGLTAVPDLDKHLLLAQTNAKTWITQTSPAMVHRITDVVGFANTWAAFVPHVKTAVASGDTATAISLLQIMRDNHLKPLMANATSSAHDAGALQVLLATDAGNFAADQTKGESTYMGDKGIIAQIDKEIANLQESMKTLYTEAAFSAVGMVIGALVVIVGFLAEIPSGGASTVVVGIGVAIAVGSGVGLAASVITYHNDLEECRKKLEDKNHDQAEMKALVTMKGQIAGLAAANGMAQSALTALSNSWSAVDGHFKTMIDDLNSGIAKPVVLGTELDAADYEWADLKKTANALADNLGVATVKVDISQHVTATATTPGT